MNTVPTVLEANLERIFNERDAARRMHALHELYAPDAIPDSSIRPPDAELAHASTPGRRPFAPYAYFCAKKPFIAASRPSTSAFSGTEIRQICTLSCFCAFFTSADSAPCVDSSGLMT